MPWYKVELMYGPGGQSHDTVYKWSSRKLDKEEERDLCREAIETHPNACCSERARADSQLVAKLPEDVRRKKVRVWEDEIEYARKMLLILEKES